MSFIGLDQTGTNEWRERTVRAHPPKPVHRPLNGEKRLKPCPMDELWSTPMEAIVTRMTSVRKLAPRRSRQKTLEYPFSSGDHLASGDELASFCLLMKSSCKRSRFAPGARRLCGKTP
jgi:hypothetical protein